MARQGPVPTVTDSSGRVYGFVVNGWCTFGSPSGHDAQHARCPYEWLTWRWQRCACPCHTQAALW